MSKKKFGSGVSKRDENGKPLVSWVDKGDGVIETTFHDKEETYATKTDENGRQTSWEVKDNDKPDTGFLGRILGRER